ncbi:MAG: BPL-N domain-containing protein [Methanobacterium sp.]|uniref:BPL-N domain-containing protein n=1 Tax=Methanobacterium sp. TaxID=2164 RepID=UPI003C71BADD
MDNILAQRDSNNNNNTSSVTKVLIYDGQGVMGSSVEGIEDTLNDSNNQNISAKNKFIYNTSSVINSNTLSGYDVLIMPGGEAADYLSNDEIDSNSIKQFVSSGKAYIGICAGAYAGSNYITGQQAGWGLAPDVNTISEDYEGLLQISTTSYGTKILNNSLTNIHMDSGPAMTTNNSQIVMATFADNNTGYINNPAIIGEAYGSGRVILSGPHPEMDPENPQLLTNMLLWVTKKIN